MCCEWFVVYWCIVKMKDNWNKLIDRKLLVKLICLTNFWNIKMAAHVTYFVSRIYACRRLFRLQDELSRVCGTPALLRSWERYRKIFQRIRKTEGSELEKRILFCGMSTRNNGRDLHICISQEFEDPRDADDAVYEMNGREMLGERCAIV